MNRHWKIQQTANRVDGITGFFTDEVCKQEKFRHEHGIKKIGPALTHFKKW
jgi:hypothetical protein